MRLIAFKRDHSFSYALQKLNWAYKNHIQYIGDLCSYLLQGQSNYIFILNYIQKSKFAESWKIFTNLESFWFIFVFITSQSLKKGVKINVSLNTILDFLPKWRISRWSNIYEDTSLIFIKDCISHLFYDKEFNILWTIYSITDYNICILWLIYIIR